MKDKLKNIFIAASCFAAVTCFSACSDWTDVESVTIKTPGINELNPELYAKYLQNLIGYKNSDHKVVYAWFDNSEKKPYSRGQHITEAPDSLDVISLMYPAALANFEKADIQAVHAKGTKVVYTISFDNIQKEYEEKVKEGKAENNKFDAYLQSALTTQLGYADVFDGIIAEYKGASPIYMSTDQKAEAKKYQDIFFGSISSWKSTNSVKILTFQGYPQNLIEQSVLNNCKHIILVTDNVTDEAQLSIVARLAMTSSNVPTDRFVATVSTVSLDTSDKKTGYYGTERALSEAAYWATEASDGYTRAGLAIYNVQNDYYNSGNSYRYIKEAINIMNPAPKK